MCDLVYDRTGSPSYEKLLRFLHSMEFVVSMDMDINRSYDGVDLRLRFGYDKGISGDIIKEEFDGENCSVLEMIVALAFRVEEHIMCDPDEGDRTGQWFWAMIVNLGLGRMTDDNFDEDIACDIIERFLYREYEPDGTGGLVSIPGSDIDFRELEIWYQVQRYLIYISE